MSHGDATVCVYTHALVVVATLVIPHASAHVLAHVIKPARHLACTHLSLAEALVSKLKTTLKPLRII